MLIPYFYRPKAETALKRKICVVPHYKDTVSSVLAAIGKNQPGLKFIDIARYNKWTDFIDQVCDCEAVFSSSLHGLIVAEAYGIQNYWIRVSGNVIGNGFKFRDYFASIGKSITEPMVLDENSDLDELKAAHSWHPGQINLKKLLVACPFEIKEPLRYEHPLDI